VLEDFGFDGLKALESVIASSKYGNVCQAMASLCVFTHPETCKQLGNQHLFPVIRQDKQHPRETYAENVMYDDNTAPTDAFLWANGIKRSDYRDVQFNHIYADSKNVELYTNLCNLVVTPAFIAKLTDKHGSQLLKYRAYDLYGFTPNGIPEKPSDYDELVWSEPLPYVESVEQVMRRIMKGKDNRTVRCARRLGWLFSDFQPDVSL
jgi:hypothetical protein